MLGRINAMFSRISFWYRMIVLTQQECLPLDLLRWYVMPQSSPARSSNEWRTLTLTRPTRRMPMQSLVASTPCPPQRRGSWSQWDSSPMQGGMRISLVQSLVDWKCSTTQHIHYRWVQLAYWFSFMKAILLVCTIWCMSTNTSGVAWPKIYAWAFHYFCPNLSRYLPDEKAGTMEDVYFI